MVTFLICLAIVCIIFLFRKQTRLEMELAKIRFEMKELRNQLHHSSPKLEHAKQENQNTQEQKVPAKESSSTPLEDQRGFKPSPAQVWVQQKIKNQIEPGSPQTQKRRPDLNQHFSKMIGRVQHNWAGILGAFILVIGVSFFAFLASEAMGPLGRFACIVLGSAAVATGGFYSRRKQRWQDYSSWLFGVAGSAFLIACLGAGGMTPLKFIESAPLALALLFLGILSNLGLAYVVRNQFATSFHGLIGLCALSYVPDHRIGLLVGAVTVLAALGLGYRRLWDKNQFAMILGYLVFHHFSYQEALTQGPPIAKLLGIFITLLVGATAAAIHYDKVYQNHRNFVWPLAGHLLNWAGIATLLLRYSQNLPWTGALVVTAGIGLLIVARYARFRGISWLYQADSLLGVLMVLVGLFMLERMEWNEDILLGLACLFVGGFSHLCLREKELLLSRVTLLVEFILFLILILWNFDPAQSSNWSPLMFLTITSLTALQFKSAANNPSFHAEIFKGFHLKSFFLAMSFVGLLMAQYTLHDKSWGTALIAAYGFLLVRWIGSHCEAESPILIPALFMSHLLLGLPLPKAFSPEAEQLWRILPLLGFDCVIIFHRRVTTYTTKVSQASVYLAASAWALLVHKLSYPASSFAPSIIALVSSVLLFEAAVQFGKHLNYRQQSRWIIHSAAGFLALFFGYHILVNISAEVLIGSVSLRSVIGGLGLATLSYWLVFARSLTFHNAFPRWMTILWEFLLGLILLHISLEIHQIYRPLVLASCSLGLTLAVLRLAWPHRLGVYAWIILLVSGIETSYILATWPDLSIGIWNSVSMWGIATLLLQIAHVYLIYRSRFWLKDAYQSSDVPWIPSSVLRLFSKFHHGMNFYPVFVLAGIFCFFHYERAVLTLLWFVEIFIVFVLGLLIRNRHFVKVAYLFLAICSGRLLFYDLAQSDLTVRAGVFVFCGALMLGINAIHRRFATRLDSAKDLT